MCALLNQEIRLEMLKTLGVDAIPCSVIIVFEIYNLQLEIDAVYSQATSMQFM